MFVFHLFSVQAVATPSLPGPRRRQRHAMMNDYTVTIPFGIAATVGGLLSLPLRVGSSQLRIEMLMHCNNHSRPCQVLNINNTKYCLCSAHAAPIIGISAHLCCTSRGFYTQVVWKRGQHQSSHRSAHKQNLSSMLLHFRGVFCSYSLRRQARSGIECPSMCMHIPSSHPCADRRCA